MLLHSKCINYNIVMTQPWLRHMLGEVSMPEGSEVMVKQEGLAIPPVLPCLIVDCCK